MIGDALAITTRTGAPVLPPPTGPRVEQAEPGPQWRIEWRGRVWRESDLKGAHLAFVALLNGNDDWQMLDVRDLNPAVGPVRLMSLISAFMAVEQGVELAEDDLALVRIIREVGEASAAELLDAVRFE